MNLHHHRWQSSTAFPASLSQAFCFANTDDLFCSSTSIFVSKTISSISRVILSFSLGTSVMMKDKFLLIGRITGFHKRSARRCGQGLTANHEPRHGKRE